MKLEHLIQAYQFNNVPATLDKQYDIDKERSGTIRYEQGITGAYLLDNEDIVINLIIYANCLVKISKDNAKDVILNKQLEHTTKVLKVIQSSIELLANVPQKETNMILDKLGLFDNTFKQGKQIKHLGYIFKVQIKEGLLIVNIIEETPGQILSQNFS